MFTEKHQPHFINPQELDRYLERGWYRMGQTIFTTHFLFYRNSLYSAIWTRLPLKGYSFRKSLRKIRNKNERAFQTVIRPANIDAEKEQLYLKYQEHFPEFRSPSLFAYLNDGKEGNIFNSLEACVYNGEELVAFSIFDVGEESLASIIGVYSPDYPSYSLGFYTMLLEIQYGLDNGFSMYYPGYIVPGRPKFDYKKRIGKPEEVEYFDLKTGNWHLISTFHEEDTPIRKITKKLGIVHSEMRNLGIYSQLLYYPSYDTSLPYFDSKYRLDAPIFLNIFPDYFNAPRYVVVYDLWKNSFSFCSTMRLEDMAFDRGQKIELNLMEHRRFMEAIFKRETIMESQDFNEIIMAAWKVKKEFPELKDENKRF